MALPVSYSVGAVTVAQSPRSVVFVSACTLHAQPNTASTVSIRFMSELLIRVPVTVGSNRPHSARLPNQSIDYDTTILIIRRRPALSRPF